MGYSMAKSMSDNGGMRLATSVGMSASQQLEREGRAMKQYYYRPIAYYQGKVLKCAGHGAEDPKHREFYVPYFDACTEPGCTFLPGVVILDGYQGDRITADTHEVFKGM